MKIGERETQRSVVLIAEVGNNHEGSIDVAREMIHVAHECGADAVKLQSLVPELFVSPHQPERLAQMRRFALAPEEYVELIVDSAASGITVFSTPLDLASLRTLAPVVSLLKISSGDITYRQLLEAAAATGVDLILSTGASTHEEVASAVEVIEQAWASAQVRPRLALLHCVSSYPAPPDSLNLGAIRTLQDDFSRCVVGYSDHALGKSAALYAVAAGARIIEKHFTLDHAFSEFRDHAMSSDPIEFAELRIALAEREVMLGTGRKEPAECEGEARRLIRRSVTARNDLNAGDVITTDDVICQRPETGVGAWFASQVIGQRVTSSIEAGTPLQLGDFDQQGHV
jgi:sialic acid synthase SpsE